VGKPVGEEKREGPIATWQAKIHTPSGGKKKNLEELQQWLGKMSQRRNFSMRC